MPNGKGTLDCCYCIHWQASNGIQGYGPGCFDGRCQRWDIDLSPAVTGCKENRICADFSPLPEYERDNRAMMEHHGHDTAESVRLRISWFAIDLRPGVLYVFHYNYPPGIRELMCLTGDEADAAGNE